MNGAASQIARRIAKGHARIKHWPHLTEDQLAQKIEDTLVNFGVVSSWDWTFAQDL